MSYVADEDVYRRFEKHIMFFHSLIAVEYAFTFFFTVNSSINVAGDHLAGGSFMERALNERLFPELPDQSLWCSG